MTAISQNLTLLKEHKSFNGWLKIYQHDSMTCKSPMEFAVFLPPQAQKKNVPVLYWLSGLTCTWENFMAKAGAQRIAGEEEIMLIAPDTSPRDTGISGEEKDWDLGSGAGFYINATQQPWRKNYRMYDYITQELPAMIQKTFPAQAERQSIFGHSMGGHGALIAALKNPKQYQSVSAFAPICAPSLCPWGQKAFRNYLGSDPQAWEEWDTNSLVKNAQDKIPFFIDQGTNDKFLKEQLKPEILKETCKKNDYPIQIRMQEGYDHSYFFIASFIEDHIRYHAKHLRCG